MRFAALGTAVLYPLFFSPVVAAAAGAVVYLLLKALRLAPDRRTPLPAALAYGLLTVSGG